MPSELSLEQQQKLNRLMARAGWPRTNDLQPDELVPGQIVPKATSTKADWFGPFRVDAPSTFQLMNAGVDVNHLIALSYKSPDDLMYSEGRVRKNGLGRGYCLAVGDYWVYVPLLTGDPSFFTARLSDASSDLPAQQNALEDGGATPGVLTVATLNRALPRFKVKTVAVPGTAEQFPSQAVPGGFKVTIKPLNTNTGAIYIAETQAKAQAAAPRVDAWDLQPGDPPINISITDWSALWIDAAVAGEGARIGSEV